MKVNISDMIKLLRKAKRKYIELDVKVYSEGLNSIDDPTIMFLNENGRPTALVILPESEAVKIMMSGSDKSKEAEGQGTEETAETETVETETK